LLLEDCGSVNGTYIKQRQDSELVPGDIFLLGRSLFRFTTQSLGEAENSHAGEATAQWASSLKLPRGPLTAKLEHIRLTGEVNQEFKLEKPETTLGRSNGDLVFKDDPFMSGTHARIVAQPGRFILQDLRSRNGVFRRVRDKVALSHGDEFFLGEHLFQVEIKQLS
jgi:pSer/pThr/pTyr-binding forkhead associated (FHA) protein